MKIISAKSYVGANFERTVIRVVENPDVAQYVHADSSTHPSDSTTSCTHTVSNDIVNESVPGCKLNWKIHEHIWTGDERYNVNSDGTKTLKTDKQLIDECKASIEGHSATAATLTSLVDLII
jgi:hypothetical protein